ncbi:very short patch repair endonuclease [Ruegeria sp. HKCCA6837]|uniref:very short patch repair endonuclease n=1 Tax=Ruegeria sp. HKCCA6837 TaxID=2682989 RepID=UPI001488AFC8|nr:very short patch repair endonuclease [Ruegeria sp. HKCCA6837]
MCADRVTTAVRSRIMASIGSKDTKPELKIRSLLHRQGFRFRLHRKDLPGKPDLVFPRYRAVIFVHGCFWHGHDCYLFSMPKSRKEFWWQKIGRNRERDEVQRETLTDLGWRVATVWECALMGRSRLSIDDVGERCMAWLQSGEAALVLRGREEGEMKPKKRL